MKNIDDQKKIAVLIDADNAQYSKIRAVLRELSKHGHLVVKRAYGDWSKENLKNWRKVLNENAVQPIQQFAYTQGKNSTDIVMIIDAMDLLYTEKYDAFALVSSDSDFTRLASRLRESEKYVFGVGQEQTPLSLKNACDDFILTENIGEDGDDESGSDEKESRKSDAPLKKRNNKQREKQLIKILYDAWVEFKDEEGWTNVAPVGALIKRQYPDFDPRTYGAVSFSDLVAKQKKHFIIERQQGKGTSTNVVYKPVKIKKIHM